MGKFLFIIAFITYTSSFGQSKLSEKQIIDKNYEEVVGDLSESIDSILPDSYPMYPNGFQGISNDISKNFKYPRSAKKRGITGKVIIQFYVGKTGEIEDITVIKSVDSELDSEAIRIIKKLQNWVPAIANGKYCRAKYKIPISFRK